MLSGLPPEVKTNLLFAFRSAAGFDVKGRQRAVVRKLAFRSVEHPDVVAHVSSCPFGFRRQTAVMPNVEGVGQCPFKFRSGTPASSVVAHHSV